MPPLTLEDVLAHLPKGVRGAFEDERVTEVMLNPDGSVWYERGGRIDRLEVADIGPPERADAVRAMAHPLGHEASAKHPIVDARLPDGSRVAILCPPVTESHAITVRRFGFPALTLGDLIKSGSVDPVLCQPAIMAVEERHNVLISGGTGSGKTTFLQALAGQLDARERLLVIEDTRELDLGPLPNLLRCEAARVDGASVSVRDLVRAALRHRPDRILVGEVRGAEALDLLQALNTGHGGSLSTIHAGSAETAPARLAQCAMQARDGLPYEAVCLMVGEAVDVVCHVERDKELGTRRVTECRELRGYDPRSGWLWGPEAERPARRRR